MLAIYATQVHPTYVRPVVYNMPIVSRVPVYEGPNAANALSDAELYHALEQHAEQQRALVARQAQQEHHRRLFNAFRSQSHINRAYRPVACYIPAPTSPNYSSLLARFVSDLSSPPSDTKSYESEYEMYRRRKAQQARAEYLNQIEQEKRTRVESAEQLAALEQALTSLHNQSYRNVNNNIVRDTPYKMPPVKHVKTRKGDDSDRLRKVAIHNARTHGEEGLPTLDNEINVGVSSASHMTEKLLAPGIIITPLQPSDQITFIDPKVPPDLSSHFEGAKLRRRREIAARAIQQHWRSRLAKNTAAKDALNTINVLSSRFEFLQSSFVPPEDLEFRQDSEKPVLLFSAGNGSINTYKHELDKLLSLADGVPSAGHEGVRNARKGFVKSVEEALEKVDTLILDIWNRQRSASSATASIPVSVSEHPPINPTTPHSDILETSFDTSPPERTKNDTDASAVIGDLVSLEDSSSSGQDTIIGTTLFEEADIARVATSPVMVQNLLPNAPASQLEDIRHSSAELEPIATLGEVQEPLQFTDTTRTHSNATDVEASFLDQSKETGACIYSEAGRNHTAFIDPPHVTALQTIDLLVLAPSELINVHEEVAIDHTNLEVQGGADINTNVGNDASYHECDLDSTTTFQRRQRTLSNTHAYTSPSLNDNRAGFASQLKSTQPFQFSEASNPVAEPGQIRNGEDVTAQLSVSSPSTGNVKTAVLSEAVETLWPVLELPYSDEALDAEVLAESSPSLLSKAVLSDTGVYAHKNEDSVISPGDFFHPEKLTMDENYDIVYPDSSSVSEDGIPDSLELVVDVTGKITQELEAVNRGDSSDGFELV